MPKTKISEFSATPGNNTDIDGINIAEGCAPSGINDAIRELMAQLKDFQAGTAGDSFNGPIGSTTPAAGAFTTLSASGNITVSGGTANGVAYLNGSKVLTTGSALTYNGTNLTFANAGGLAIFARASDALLTGIVGSRSGTDVSLYNAGGTTAEFVAGANELRFNVAASEQARLTSVGLGIGTSSPGNRLHVQGAGDVARFTNGTNSAYFAIDSAGYTLFTGAGQTGNGLYARASDNTLQLWTNSTAKVFLDSSGNLGLGVTPSAWNAMRALQINEYGSAIAAWNTNRNTYILSNAYYDAAFKFSTTATASAVYYNASGETGVHSWHTAGAPASRTAGNTISFTQAMTLTSGGSLYIGTTTGGGPLQVKTSAGQWRIEAYSTGTKMVSVNSADNAEDILGVQGSTIAFLTGSTERARITSGGNLLVKTTEANGITCHFNGGLNNNIIRLTGASTTNSGYIGMDGDNFTITTGASILERARITSGGDLLVGTTGAGAGVGFSTKVAVDASGTFGMVIKSNNAGFECLDTWNTAASGTIFHIYFRDGAGATARGSITTNGAATSFNTSSDYRLKNITGPVTNSGAYIDSLKPVEGTWKADGSTFVGLIAHEAQEVSRTQVATGTKDGEQMQGMDYSNSEFIANIIAELQSLRARVAQLEAK